MVNIHGEQKTISDASQSDEREVINAAAPPVASWKLWPQRLWGITRRYPVPFGTVSLMVLSLVLWLAGYGDFANLVLLAVALLGAFHCCGRL